MVRLSWQTDDELNTDHFEIEKSEDALKWKSLGNVKAAGNSTEIREYVFTDTESFSARSFYRIAGIDSDGSKRYTRIETAACRSDQHVQLTIVPNPAGEKLKFGTSDSFGSILQISIYRSDGQLLIQLPDETAREVDISHLPAGLYILQIADPKTGTSASSTFIKP